MKYLIALSILLMASCVMRDDRSPRIRNPIKYNVRWVESTVEGHRSVTGRVSLPRPTANGGHRDYETDAVINTSSGEIIKARWPEWNNAIYTRSSEGRDLLNIEQRRALWARMSSKFDPSKEYHIELLTKIYGSKSHIGFSGISNDILRVSTKDQTIIDASICQVHRLPMERVVMEPRSVERYPLSFFTLQKKKFPNDGNEYLSCSSGPSDLNWKCSECSRLYFSCIKRTGWGD